MCRNMKPLYPILISIYISNYHVTSATLFMIDGGEILFKGKETQGHPA